MNLRFNTQLASHYKSPSQKIRVLTESWVNSYIFCPSCGYNINKYEDNKPVADFYCERCKEDFELKSSKNSVTQKIVNGAYSTMMERLKNSQNPNLFLLNYNQCNLEVINFFTIPKYFFVPSIIEKRRPLSQYARRAGWIGCNILLCNIPHTGRIFFIKEKEIKSKEEVLRGWRKTAFLKEEKELSAKGWLLDIMNCIDKLNKREFALSEMYIFEKELSLKYPNNQHIKDKVRQQLQFLRDKGYLEFLGRGKYRLI